QTCSLPISSREQVASRTVSAVVVGRRRLDRQVHETKIFVDADLSPDADVAIDRPRLVLPRPLAVVARAGNLFNRPQPLAGPDIERPHEPLRVVVGGDGRALAH